MNLKFNTILLEIQKESYDSLSFPSTFAINRFWKKFEKPGDVDQKELHTNAWDLFLDTDLSLPKIQRVDGLWYKVREVLHSLPYHLDWDSIDFPKGSEFIATNGKNSIEARLVRSTWTVTKDCFDDFARIIYGHAALKRAFRYRFKAYCSKHSLSNRHISRFLWGRYKNAYTCFRMKLSLIVQFEHGSRFSTVPKNNSVRRPINIECMGNMIVQKVIGNCFRNLVRDCFGNDLATLQNVHVERLVDKSISTIDLKNASDSISWDLVQFLFPKNIVRALSKARSEMILGPDDNYYQLRKVSSMGNGFTFELMTLILTVLCRTLDPSSSVYGDDIIISNEHAPRLIKALTSVGFTVNLEKSFVNSPFRESCGGNFHDGYGYIKSYDFKFPENIHDQIIFFNKLNELEHIEFFRILRDKLLNVLDPALRGPRICEPSDLTEGGDYRTLHGLSNFFRTDTKPVVLKKFRKFRQQIALRYHYDIDSIEIFAGFVFKPTELTRMSSGLSSRQVGKYAMYLHAGRRCKDTLTGNGKWIKTYYVAIEGRISTLSSLLAS